MKNKESGVTLIVLVVAIISLLLVAAITINMAARQLGLFSQGQQTQVPDTKNETIITNRTNTLNEINETNTMNETNN